MRIFFVSLCAASVSLAVQASAGAQTISFADAVGQVAQACRSDIAKYCGKTPLGSGLLLQCLNQNENVRPECKQTISNLTAVIRVLSRRAQIFAFQPTVT